MRAQAFGVGEIDYRARNRAQATLCLLYTSDAADERSSVDLGGRRIIQKKNKRIFVDAAARKKKTENPESIQHYDRK